MAKWSNSISPEVRGLVRETGAFLPVGESSGENPAKFNGREVIVKAGLRIGFEWQELLCFSCESNDKIDVEFDPEARGLRRIGNTKYFDQIFKVKVRGVFSEESVVAAFHYNTK